MAKRLEIQLYNTKAGEGITLPLNPESTDIPTEKDIKTYNILDYGEIAVRGGIKLQRINLTNFLPELNSPWALLASMLKNLKYQVYTPTEAMAMFNRWIEEDAIIRVIIAGYINKLFTVERHVASIKENTEALYYSIDLIEYKNPNAQNLIPKSNLEKIKEKVGNTKVGQAIKTVKLKTRSIEKYIPSRYIAPKGATIYKIAKLTYGGRNNELAKLNNIIDQNVSVAGQAIEMLSLEKTFPNTFSG